MYLPTQDDWIKWNNLNKRYIPLLGEHPIINILPILIFIDEWIDEERPPTRQEIRKYLYESGGTGPNGWQLIIPAKPIAESTGGNKGKSPSGSKSSEHVLYKYLEVNEIISSETVSDFFKKNKTLPRAAGSITKAEKKISGLHGREILYSLTPLGEIYLELLLQIPWLSLTLDRNYVKRGFSTISILSWTRLKDPSKLKKTSNQNFRNNQIINELGFHNFWKMKTPITRILVEFGELTTIIEYYERIINRGREGNKTVYTSGIRVKDDRWVPDNLTLIATEEFQKIARAYLDLIVFNAEELGLSLETLKKHSPVKRGITFA